MTSTTSSNESESTGAGLTNGGSATTTATKAPNPTDNSDRLTSIDESVPSLASCDSTSTNTDQQAPIIPLPNDELDLLVKLERANKEMETNHRSAQSILSSATTNGNTTNNSSPPSHSLSRRASFTSCEVNSLNNDEGEPSDKFEISIKHIGSFLAEKKSEFLNKISPIGDKEIEEEDEGKTDEVSWELWNQIIADWSTWSKKKPSQLREYIRRGIPIYLRPLAWQYLCGAHLTDAKDKYKEYLKKSSSCEKLIRRDVDRTYPESELFRTAVGQESLFNVMKAYSIHDPEVGYCQGSAFICGLLLIQNVPEEEAFAIFVQIMQHYNLREIYKPNMYHLGLCMFQLDSLLQEFLPDLHRHFVTHAFHPSMYCSSWFLTLFTTSLPLPLVCRIFDIFLNEGFEIIFRVGLAILDFHKDILITLDMEGMLKYFQKELPPKHETDHDTILNKAFAIKYNQRKMKKLEKDFSILKKEEQEEQVEMRRLRAENKLLKQRIDNLEKESAQLAERLIKGQVVNAQNAESIYVLKNENQKLKEKINELQLECEHSNELRRKQMSEHSLSSSERDALNERVNVLLEENNRLRDKPENARLEEELLSVKMREAEAQLAIKELQKTIHVLNLEYQEFLNNRQAFIISSPSSQAISVTNGNSTVSTSSTTATTNSSSSNGANGGNNNNGASQPGANDSVSSSNCSVVVVNKTQIGGMQYQQLEEELLKIKLREAEALSEMKSLNLKLMQLDTEKQVAYNQIKRQDEEIRKLNQQISHILEKELDQKSQLVELRRQLDDKDALLKELNMTHKLQEAEDAHLIAELRQRVASLEVNIQELETTGQLNQHDLAYLATSTDNLVLASPTSTTAPTLDRRSSFKIISRQMRNNSTNIMPVGYNTNMNAVGGASSNRYDDDSASSSGGGMNNSLSLSSIPSATAAATVTTTSSVNAMTNHVELNGDKKSAINRSYSIDSGGVKLQLGNHQNHEPLQPLKSTKTKQQHQESNNSAENSVAAKINSKEAVKAEYLHNENDEDKLNESQKSTTSSSSTNDTSNTSDSTNAINNTNNSTAIATNEEAN